MLAWKYYLERCMKRCRMFFFQLTLRTDQRRAVAVALADGGLEAGVAVRGSTGGENGGEYMLRLRGQNCTLALYYDSLSC